MAVDYIKKTKELFATILGVSLPEEPSAAPAKPRASLWSRFSSWLSGIFTSRVKSVPVNTTVQAIDARPASNGGSFASVLGRLDCKLVNEKELRRQLSSEDNEGLVTWAKKTCEKQQVDIKKMPTDKILVGALELTGQQTKNPALIRDAAALYNVLGYRNDARGASLLAKDFDINARSKSNSWSFSGIWSSLFGGSRAAQAADDHRPVSIAGMPRM